MTQPSTSDWTCLAKLELISSWMKLMNIMSVSADATCGIGTTNKVISHTKLLRVKVSHVLESFRLSFVNIQKKCSSLDKNPRSCDTLCCETSKNIYDKLKVSLLIRIFLDELTTLEQRWDLKRTAKFRIWQVWLLFCYKRWKIERLLILFVASSSLMDPTTNNPALRRICYFSRVKTF